MALSVKVIKNYISLSYSGSTSIECGTIANASSNNWPPASLQQIMSYSVFLSSYGQAYSTNMDFFGRLSSTLYTVPSGRVARVILKTLSASAYTNAAMLYSHNYLPISSNYLGISIPPGSSISISAQTVWGNTTPNYIVASVASSKGWLANSPVSNMSKRSLSDFDSFIFQMNNTGPKLTIGSSTYFGSGTLGISAYSSSFSLAGPFCNSSYWGYTNQSYSDITANLLAPSALSSSLGVAQSWSYVNIQSFSIPSISYSSSGSSWNFVSSGYGSINSSAISPQSATVRPEVYLSASESITLQTNFGTYISRVMIPHLNYNNLTTTGLSSSLVTSSSYDPSLGWSYYSGWSTTAGTIIGQSWDFGEFWTMYSLSSTFNLSAILSYELIVIEESAT